MCVYINLCENSIIGRKNQKSASKYNAPVVLFCRFSAFFLNFRIPKTTTCVSAFFHMHICFGNCSIALFLFGEWNSSILCRK